MTIFKTPFNWGKIKNRNLPISGYGAVFNSTL